MSTGPNKSTSGRIAIVTTFMLSLLVACGDGSGVDRSGSIQCRNDCSSPAITCSNNCNDDDTPGCRTNCARVELACQKDCETRYPLENDIQCRNDCSSFHSTCFNDCNSQDSPDTCQASCGTEQLACQKDCATRYP